MYAIKHYVSQETDTAYLDKPTAYNSIREVVDMEDIKQTTQKKDKYKVTDLFPGKVFSKAEQQKVATQISNILNQHKDIKNTATKSYLGIQKTML